jgi:hypothetical protein
LEKYKIKFYETSALSGNNVENMFFSLIDDINVLQQQRKKKAKEDDLDFNAPLTTDNLKSERITARNTTAQSEKEDESHVVLKNEKKNRFCCYGA